MNKELKILIVEDELVIAENTKLLIQELYQEIEINIAGSAEEAHEILKEYQPSLVLLDIRLGEGENGIIFSENLENQKIPFLFITAHGDKNTVSSAIKTKPLAYLIKPISKQDLFVNLELAFTKINQEKYYSFKEGTHLIKIKENQIIYLKSDNIYTEIYTDDKRYVLRKSTKNVLGELSLTFLQTHRSYFVNPNYIKETNAFVYLLNGQEIPLSRNFKQAVNDFVFNFKNNII